MNIKEGFETSITFPKKKNTALEFEDIIKNIARKLLKGIM